MYNAKDEPNFSSPWHMSDVTLVVERQRLHTHRSILSMSSPVFERMFNADFREKRATEIPLPGKKAHEIRELLLVLYPTAKPITDESVYFLLTLAQEYQMVLVTKRCQEYILQRKKGDADAVIFLVMAQEFGLKELRKQCVEIAKNIPSHTLRKIKNYHLIESEVGRELAEKRVEVLENQIAKVRKEFEASYYRIHSWHYTGKDTPPGWPHQLETRSFSRLLDTIEELY